MDKYRARLERTEQNTSEIFVSHRGMIEVYTTAGQDQTKWQARPSDPDLEAEILQRLLVQFDASAAKATATAAARARRHLPRRALPAPRRRLPPRSGRAW